MLSLDTIYITGLMYEYDLPESLTDEDYAFLYPFGRIHHGFRMYPRSLVYDVMTKRQLFKAIHNIYLGYNI